MFDLKLIIILVVATLVAPDPIPFNDCGSLYDLLEVDVEGCEDRLPCHLKKYGYPNVHIKLFAKFKSEVLDQGVLLNIYGLNINVTVRPENPCTGIKCPVYNQNYASFSAVLDLSDSRIPSQIESKLFWSIKNEKRKQIMCMETDVYIE